MSGCRMGMESSETHLLASDGNIEVHLLGDRDGVSGRSKLQYIYINISMMN